MSLELLIDEDSQDKLFVKLLRQASHDVITVNEAELMGQPDSVVLDYAKKSNRILLTYNCDDFEALHEANSTHSGILAIYRSSNRSKNMTFKDIVRAIANLESATFPLANQFISLNHWNYKNVNLQTSITDPLGNTSTTQYNAVGNAIALTDPLGNKTTYGYDKLYRLASQTDGENRTTT